MCAGCFRRKIDELGFPCSCRPIKARVKKCEKRAGQESKLRNPTEACGGAQVIPV